MSESQAFSPKTVLWGVAASVLAFAAFLVLATYAPDFQQMPRGAATTESKAGNGYAGLVKLLRLTGEDAYLTSEPSFEDTLVVVPIDIRTDPERLRQIAKEREGLETLFILPKWHVVNDRRSATKVRKTDPIDEAMIQSQIEAIGADLPDMEFAQSANVPIAIGDTGHFVVANADLLNNAGLASREGARRALNLIHNLKIDHEDAIAFDISLARAPKSQSIAKLALEPPFLALTLAMLVAAVLAFLGGLGRFGPPRRAVRSIEFGKRALADATARLMRRGKRIAGLGDRYADVMRTRAAIAMQAPTLLKGPALDTWLDARGATGQHEFTSRLTALRQSTDERSLLANARHLHRWIEGKHLGNQ